MMLVSFTLVLVMDGAHEAKIDLPGEETRGETIGTSWGAFSTPIGISPSTPSPGYVVRVDIDRRFDYSRCLPDGGDVRFFAGAQELPYWIESWNDENGKSTIWVKVLAAGTSNIDMEYGNSSATPVSNGDATFVFFDNFSGSALNTSKWTTRTDTYSTVTFDDGYAWVISDTPADSRSNYMFGFHDYTISGGTTLANNGIVASNNIFDTRSAGVSATATPYYIGQKWAVVDICWINSSLVRFVGNDDFVASHTSQIPSVNLPLRFFARGMYYGGGVNYGSYISTVNATIGRPGYAMRARAWCDSSYTTISGARIPKIFVDYVFIRKCVASEPVATVNYGALLDSVYSRDITLTPGTTIPDQVVRVDLNSSFNYARAAFDGRDIRFFDPVDSSLSYWIETWKPGGISTMWVKVPVAGTSALRMEYGNWSLPAASNGEATFTFFEDFSGNALNTSKWTSTITPTFGYLYVQNGILSLVSDPYNVQYPRACTGFADFDGSAEWNNAVITGAYEVVQTEASGTGTQTVDRHYEKWETHQISWMNSSDAK